MLHRLSVRLMLTIGLLTALIFAFISLVTWHLHEQHLQDELIRHAAVLSETIRRSLRDQMLANRRNEVNAIIQQIGSQSGIHRIRIFNKQGGVVISTDSTEVGTVADLSTEACVACHVEGTPRVVLANPERTRIYRCCNGYRVLGMITPIPNEPACSNAACHAHPPEKNILGVLDVGLSLEKTDASLRDEANKFIAVSILGCLLIVGATGVSLWRLVYRPINDLALGTRALSSGNLDYRIPEQSTDEFSALACSFNRMTADLKTARDEIIEWNRTLERRVAEKTRQLEEAHQRMIQTEKMASLGKLAAVVAHEINNPLAGILTYIKLLRRMVKKGAERLDVEAADQYLGMMEAETVRVGEIVKNLLAFSRPSKPGVDTVDLNGTIMKSLNLIDHQMDLQNIEYRTDLAEDIPPIKGDPAQIQQMLLALLINAVEAMPGGGVITVTSRYDPQARQAKVYIADTGVGIRKEDLPHLFEPFFTTKTDGKGVGLGLFVVYGIVQRHGGSIEVQSELNRGTTFIITLPQDGPKEEKPAEGAEALKETGEA